MFLLQEVVLLVERPVVAVRHEPDAQGDGEPAAGLRPEGRHAAPTTSKLLRTYALTHRKDGRPYLAEALHPDTGSFEGHDGYNHSEHYFHSSFNDLVITGLVGLRRPLATRWRSTRWPRPSGRTSRSTTCRTAATASASSGTATGTATAGAGAARVRGREGDRVVAQARETDREAPAAHARAAEGPAGRCGCGRGGADELRGEQRRRLLPASDGVVLAPEDLVVEAERRELLVSPATRRTAGRARGRRTRATGSSSTSARRGRSTR